MKTLNETSARRLRRAAQHSINSRKTKEQEYNFSNFSDNSDLTKLRDEMVRAYNRTERAIQLAQKIPDSKKITAKDAIIIMQHTFDDSINLMEEICDVVEKCSFSERVNENKVKKEPFKLIEEAYGLLSSIFEVDDVEDTSQEHNKIKRETKDREGNKVDVVSVEDELFPYAGNAKQQFNQKVIAKINDMIEGKATLEDLIQLVRSKTVAKKQG